MDKSRNISHGKGAVRLCKTLFLLLILFVSVSCSSGKEEVAQPADLRGGETRDTLPPYYFTGDTAAAYKAAKDIPEVLDSLYCYCDCKKNMGHKSLLTCYVNKHGAYCDICINEALMAKRMHSEGADAATIRKAVDKKFKKIHDQRMKQMRR